MLATRSQLSVEFVLLFSGLVLIFVLLFGIYFDKNDELYDQRLRFEAKEIMHEVAFTANIVYLAGPDTNTSLLLPITLSGKELYDISVYNNSILINWSRGSLTYPLIFDGLTFTSSSTGDYDVYNINGEVFISWEKHKFFQLMLL